MPFCAASATITRIRMSAMPTEPTRRLTTTRNRTNRNRYIALPRTISSHGDTLMPNSSPQSMRGHSANSEPGAATGEEGGIAATPGRMLFSVAMNVPVAGRRHIDLRRRLHPGCHATGPNGAFTLEAHALTVGGCLHLEIFTDRKSTRLNSS